MLPYAALGVAAALAALSLVLPTTRRVWVFHAYLLWHFPILGLASALQLRRLWAALARRPYEPWTGPRACRLFCEDMGPTFIKLGQIVASSVGMFPDRYSEEFRKCLDAVKPFRFDDAVDVLRRELGDDKLAQLDDIDPTPLASASIAQVHTARLGDDAVVIKIQRPGIEARVAADMRILRVVARLAQRFVRDAELANPVGIVEDFADTLREEMDFRMEARNLDQFNDIQREIGFHDVRAPVPYWDYTTKRVLVMERFFGTRVDRITSLEGRGIDPEEKLIRGMLAWFRCVIFYGFFHGDVHAGNLMLLDNGDLGFLDFGIVGRFDERQRAMVTDYLVAFTTGDYRALARVIGEMGGVTDGVDMDAFVADLKETYSPLLTMQMADINLADFIPRIHRVATRHRMRMPKEFVLITKQMLYFDRYAKILAPKLNVFTDPRLLMSMMQDIKRARDELRARGVAS
ncbi:MAG: AarF/ABC1/UbiB kinase family protein [Deltaproteobacteria bacterium]|nr:MAG: AarF/ABC1/UbiB kinase family protein [Deltaproteobacteria bacterium]